MFVSHIAQEGLGHTSVRVYIYTCQQHASYTYQRACVKAGLPAHPDHQKWAYNNQMGDYEVLHVHSMVVCHIWSVANPIIILPRYEVLDG